MYRSRWNHKWRLFFVLLHLFSNSRTNSPHQRNSPCVILNKSSFHLAKFPWLDFKSMESTSTFQWFLLKSIYWNSLQTFQFLMIHWMKTWMHLYIIVDCLNLVCAFFKWSTYSQTHIGSNSKQGGICISCSDHPFHCEGTWIIEISSVESSLL